MMNFSLHMDSNSYPSTRVNVCLEWKWMVFIKKYFIYFLFKWTHLFLIRTNDKYFLIWICINIQLSVYIICYINHSRYARTNYKIYISIHFTSSLSLKKPYKGYNNIPNVLPCGVPQVWNAFIFIQTKKQPKNEK